VAEGDSIVVALTLKLAAASCRVLAGTADINTEGSELCRRFGYGPVPSDKMNAPTVYAELG